MYSFPNLEPVCCSMSSSNCCFLTCIQVSQEAGQVVWYSHLFKNFQQFVVIQTVKGFSIVSEAEAYVFLKFSCFFYDPIDVGNLISVSSAFSKSSLYIWKSSILINSHILQSADHSPATSSLAGSHGRPYYDLLVSEWAIRIFSSKNKVMHFDCWTLFSITEGLAQRPVIVWSSMN